MTTNLYETDYGQWLEEQIIALKNHDAIALDWDNLFEEIESLGASDRRAINKLTYQLLMHLLLYDYWTDHRDLYLAGWKEEIRNFRLDLWDYIDSKTWYNYFQEQFEKNYKKALKSAILKADGGNLYTSPNFPAQCPFTLKQILDEDWYPNHDH